VKVTSDSPEVGDGVARLIERMRSLRRIHESRSPAIVRESWGDAPNQPEEDMSTQTKTATDLFEEAYKSYDQALKTGIKVQEDTVKMWKDLLSKTSSPTEFQAKFTEMVESVFPAAKKRMEEALKSVEENYKTSTSLLQQAMQIWQPGSVAETQNRIQGLWETSLSAARTNVQNVVKTNQQILDAWTGLASNGSKKAGK
jgi:polyhydroxyalkanoate synthesis regulator protein